MKILRNTALLVAGAVLMAACAPRAPDTAADEAALRADPAAWFDAYNAGNADAVANLYTEDATLMPPETPALQGRAAILGFITADIAASKAAGVAFKLGDITGTGASGDLGWLSGNFSVVDGAGAAVSNGKFLSVYRRENGGWQLIRDTWNSDAPAPVAPSEVTQPAN